MTLKERLIQFIAYKNLNISRFNRIIGVSPSYVQNMSNNIGVEIRERISQAFPELNMEWLIRGEGDMIIKTDDKPTKLLDGQKTILVIPTYAQGGSLTDVVESIHDYDCEKIISPIIDAEMAIMVTGDSMSPEYPNGSRVIIKRVNEKAFLDWGRTYVLDTCNGIVIKNLYPSSLEGYVRCVSINPNYPPFDISMDDIRGYWRVLMCQSMK